MVADPETFNRLLEEIVEEFASVCQGPRDAHGHRGVGRSLRCMLKLLTPELLWLGPPWIIVSVVSLLR